MGGREDTVIPLEKPVQSQYYFPHQDTSNSLPNISQIKQETEPVPQQVGTPVETEKVSTNRVVNWKLF